MIIPPNSKREATFLRPDRCRPTTTTIPTLVVVVRPTRPAPITCSSIRTIPGSTSWDGVGGFFPFAALGLIIASVAVAVVVVVVLGPLISS